MWEPALRAKHSRGRQAADKFRFSQSSERIARKAGSHGS